MSASTIFLFIHENLTSLLTGITLISFMLNIYQHFTHKHLRYHFESIKKTCDLYLNSKLWSSDNNEISRNIICIIRLESVAGLRSMNVSWEYSIEDINPNVVPTKATFTRFRNTYYLLMALRLGIANLVRGKHRKFWETVEYGGIELNKDQTSQGFDKPKDTKL